MDVTISSGTDRHLLDIQQMSKEYLMCTGGVTRITNQFNFKDVLLKNSALELFVVTGLTIDFNAFVYILLDIIVSDLCVRFS